MTRSPQIFFTADRMRNLSSISDIVIGRVETLDIVKLLLLVDVDEDAAVERVPEAGSFHLARLEHGIAVGEDDGVPHCCTCFTASRAPG